MDEVIAADREAVTISPEREDMKVIVAQTDAGGKWERAPVQIVAAVSVDEIGETRRAADPGKGDDLLVWVVEAFENTVERRQNSEVSTSWTPSRMIRG